MHGIDCFILFARMKLQLFLVYKLGVHTQSAFCPQNFNI